MNIIFKNILTSFLAFYVLLISSGFTISHIYCSKGESYFIGSEMLPCKKQGNSTCPLQKENNKGCCHNPNNNDCSKKPNNRKKDTIVFFCKLQSVSVQNDELIKPVFPYFIKSFI